MLRVLPGEGGAEGGSEAPIANSGRSVLSRFASQNLRTWISTERPEA
jgi:hypothetical protein